MPRVWVAVGYRNDLVAGSQKDGDHNYLLARRPSGWLVLLLQSSESKYVRWLREIRALSFVSRPLSVSQEY